ncbi:MAG: SemiSWEET transporter [Synechococcaceae cyanobacterium RM1_1_27]|nr:SemiSWEET transporter [Synechococcaceae cyanobacterium RM1_1_27]
MESFIPWVGIIAACLTTGSFLPQAIKTMRTRSTEDFSWSYLTLFTLGIAFWNWYGWLRQDSAIVVANTITLAFAVGYH